MVVEPISLCDTRPLTPVTFGMVLLSTKPLRFIWIHARQRTEPAMHRVADHIPLAPLTHLYNSQLVTRKWMWDYG